MTCADNGRTRRADAAGGRGGRAWDLFDQAGGPIDNPIEMAITKDPAIEQLNPIPGYVEGFRTAFPGKADPVSAANVQMSIALFEAKLITSDAPFGRYLGGGQYQPFGVVEKPGAGFLPLADAGWFEVAKSVDDEYVFKVPTPRYVALTRPVSMPQRAGTRSRPSR